MENQHYSKEWYHLSGQTILVTGGAGVLGSAISRALVHAGANVVILDLSLASLADDPDLTPITAIQTDVLDVASLRHATEQVLTQFGRIDGVVNAAGGNKPQATASAGHSFFDLPPEAIRWVSNLNLIGTILPCQIFSRVMARQQAGVILNIASIAGLRPLTRTPAYCAAKAAVGNFTQWLAVHLAQEYSPQIRVNALAPGFFLTTQNHYLLIDPETQTLTRRGQTIIGHTPMGRFGDPKELVGAALWLLSPASSFVTGAVIPVDGGFTAFSGV